MGCYGYICNGCTTGIRHGEKTILKHVRHGEILGVTNGYYNSYGSVDGAIQFCTKGEGTNSHEEIGISKSRFPDSIHYNAKLVNGKPMFWIDFRDQLIHERAMEMLKEAQTQKDYDTIIKEIRWDRQLLNELNRKWSDFEDDPKITPSRSGIEAWHQACYDKAPQEEKDRHVISETDPEQAAGFPRKKYK